MNNDCLPTRKWLMQNKKSSLPSLINSLPGLPFISIFIFHSKGTFPVFFHWGEVILEMGGRRINKTTVNRQLFIQGHSQVSTVFSIASITVFSVEAVHIIFKSGNIREFVAGGK